MPKMRTHSGTKKRVRRTASGKLKVSHSQRGHLLGAKNKNTKKHNAKTNYVSASDVKRIKQQIANVK